MCLVRSWKLQYFLEKKETSYINIKINLPEHVDVVVVQSEPAAVAVVVVVEDGDGVVIVGLQLVT